MTNATQKRIGASLNLGIYTKLSGFLIADPVRCCWERCRERGQAELDRLAMEALNRVMWASASAAVAAWLLEVYDDTGIGAMLSAIRARTAVLHREAYLGTGFELGREVAALIPGATLIPLPGSSHLFYHGDWPAVLDAVLGFLCEPASPGPRLTGRGLEVAGLIAGWPANQAIARRLPVAPRTAGAHAENIRCKLGVRSRAQIVAWVTEQRLRC
jgi:DNA-binding CsgD family transcriptional regulator